MSVVIYCWITGVTTELTISASPQYSSNLTNISSMLSSNSATWKNRILSHQGRLHRLKLLKVTWITVNKATLTSNPTLQNWVTGGLVQSKTCFWDLSWNDHIDIALKKVNHVGLRTSSVIITSYTACTLDIMEQCYKTLVQFHPILDYVSSVWGVHTLPNIKKSEMMQRSKEDRAACMTTYDFAITIALRWTAI